MAEGTKLDRKNNIIYEPVLVTLKQYILVYYDNGEIWVVIFMGYAHLNVPHTQL